MSDSREEDGDRAADDVADDVDGWWASDEATFGAGGGGTEGGGVGGGSLVARPLTRVYDESTRSCGGRTGEVGEGGGLRIVGIRASWACRSLIIPSCFAFSS